MQTHSLSCVQVFATPWGVAHQAPRFTKFSRQEYWSGLPFPSPEIFQTQGSNPGLLHSGQMLYRLSHLSPVSSACLSGGSGWAAATHCLPPCLSPTQRRLASAFLSTLCCVPVPSVPVALLSQVSYPPCFSQKVNPQRGRQSGRKSPKNKSR